MSTIAQLIRRLHEDEKAATATEYIVLLILIACFIVIVVKVFGDTLRHKFADANNAVNRRVTF